MSNILLPDYLFAILLFFIWFSSTIWIGKSMNESSNKFSNDVEKGPPIFQILQHYKKWDWILTLFGLVMLFGVLFFMYQIFQLNDYIVSLPSGDAKENLARSLISLMGFGLSLFVLAINYLTDIPNRVASNLRHEEIISRLKELKK